MHEQRVDIDIAILGGGIAGLWALNMLRSRGFSVALFEAGQLGAGQSMHSQGIIHGGIKYALNGKPGSASEALATMPQAWLECLQGTGDIDLTSCRVLSNDFYLVASGMGARLGNFFASKILRERVDKVSADQTPTLLRGAQHKGPIYKINERVLDVPSLLKALAAPHQNIMFKIDWESSKLHVESGKAHIQLPNCSVFPKQLVLTAGAGNESLLRQLHCASPRMQRRPLHQVVVKHQYEDPLYAHFLARGTTPRLTLSSHRDRQGDPVWYLGGQLAELGTKTASAQLIEVAQRELRSLMPWLDLQQARWSTFQTDRAEYAQPSGTRHADVFVERPQGITNALVAWPSKLALAPRLGRQILNALAVANIAPGQGTDNVADLSPLQTLGSPDLAKPCWEATPQ